jgi:hypothetical protein
MYAPTRRSDPWMTCAAAAFRRSVDVKYEERHQAGATAVTDEMPAHGLIRSVSIILDPEQWERAEYMRRVGRRGRVQVGAVEVGESCHPEEPETALHLVLE